MDDFRNEYFQTIKQSIARVLLTDTENILNINRTRADVCLYFVFNYIYVALTAAYFLKIVTRVPCQILSARVDVVVV